MIPLHVQGTYPAPRSSGSTARARRCRHRVAGKPQVIFRSDSLTVSDWALPSMRAPPSGQVQITDFFDSWLYDGRAVIGPPQPYAAAAVHSPPPVRRRPLPRRSGPYQLLVHRPAPTSTALRRYSLAPGSVLWRYCLAPGLPSGSILSMLAYALHSHLESWPSW